MQTTNFDPLTNIYSFVALLFIGAAGVGIYFVDRRVQEQGRGYLRWLVLGPFLLAGFVTSLLTQNVIASVGGATAFLAEMVALRLDTLAEKSVRS